MVVKMKSTASQLIPPASANVRIARRVAKLTQAAAALMVVDLTLEHAERPRQNYEADVEKSVQRHSTCHLGAVLASYVSAQTCARKKNFVFTSLAVSGPSDPAVSN
jgi:hypothetical protein